MEFHSHKSHTNCLQNLRNISPISYKPIRNLSNVLSQQFVIPSRLVLGVLSVISLFTFAQARENATTKDTFKSCWLWVVCLVLMAAGASAAGASGSGRTRGRGQRGGDGGRARGRGQRGRDVGRGSGDGRQSDVEDVGESGGEGDDDEEIEGEVRFGRAPRSISWGDYKTKPTSGQPKIGVVHFISGKCIKEAKYKKTLKNIVRMHMTPNTIFQKGLEREAFYDECIVEFRDFYDYPPEYIKRNEKDEVDYTEGDNVVRKHLKTNFKQYMNCEKNDADKRAVEARKSGNTAATRRTCKPHYLSDETWEAMNVYWDSELFAKKSEHGKEAREKVSMLHSSGAKPFEHLYEDMEEKSQRTITILDKFDASYKKKSEEVEKIGKKLKEFVEASSKSSTNEPPPSPYSRRKQEVQLMLQARSPKKGKTLMYPRHTISEILGEEEAGRWTSSQSSSTCIPEGIPEHGYSIIGRVMTEVTDMVEAMEEIEVPRARLNEEVQRLASGAYPNRDDPASQVLWEEYIRIAAQMIDSLFQRFNKVIIEGARVEKSPINTYEDDDDEDNIARRYPL